jgi:hypothetical protein
VKKKRRSLIEDFFHRRVWKAPGIGNAFVHDFSANHIQTQKEFCVVFAGLLPAFAGQLKAIRKGGIG